MPETADWGKLASALRELHRTLLEHARRGYERERGAELNPGQLLQLLATDGHFAWLRSLSELMVDIDMLREAQPVVMDDAAAGVRLAVEHLITPPKTPAAADSFAGRYGPCLQDDPHVAMAHAGVKRSIASWPLPGKTDAATVLHERHLLAEKARHRPR